jgi:uncharacterized repeat protein (TIGR01451 family)
MAVEDLLGNQFVRHYGPWHVGTTADLATAFANRVQTIVVDGEIDIDVAVAEVSDFGWEWGIYEFVDDYENSPEFWDWWDRHNLFATWDGANLFLGYEGAWWDIDGDLWAYVGTQSGGSTLTVVPMSSTVPFEADMAIHVGGAEDATLWTWDGSAWQSSVFPGEFAQGDSGDTEIRLPLAMDTISQLEMIVFALDENGEPWSVFPTTNPLGGSWSDLYLWENISETLTTTLEELIGYSLQVDLDSPQAPQGVWGPGDQIEYVVELTNWELYTLTGQVLDFDVGPGVEFQAVSGATISDTWEFVVPALPPGSSHLVTVTVQLLNDLCSLVAGEEISVSLTLDILPPIHLSLEHRIDCEPPVLTLPSQWNVGCWQQAVYGSASDGDGSGVVRVEFRPVGSAEWRPAEGTLFWAAEMPLTVPEIWEIELRALDRYSHTSPIMPAQFNVGLVTDLALVKTVTPTVAAPGQIITYTLSFVNEGACLGRGVVISDALPVSVTVSGVINAGAAITPTGSVWPLAWQVQDLAPGEGGVITITAVLNDTLTEGQVLTNTAVITCTTTDSDPGNNRGRAGMTVIPGELHRIYLPLIFRGG